MKIGIFTDTYDPQINGVATSVLMLKENLEKQGHIIYIFTTTDPKASTNERNVYKEETQCLQSICDHQRTA